MFRIRAWVLGCSEKSKMVIIANTPAVRLIELSQQEEN